MLKPITVLLVSHFFSFTLSIHFSPDGMQMYGKRKNEKKKRLQISHPGHIPQILSENHLPGVLKFRF